MQESNSSSNKRIAKNTLLLYARMLLLLVISLYTSRIVLATLGFEDYGLYNVVGGVVTMFTFLNAAMGNSSHRYITFALGKGDEKELHDIVSATCIIHWILAGVIFILAETIGLWFLHYKMVIPEGRMFAVDWVYQFSIIACIVSITSVPYNAMIIAHEKMGAFAGISILDAALKLLIVYLVQVVEGDKLILYAALILGVNILDRLIYQIYCKRHFPESRNIKFQRFDKLKEMTSFAGWSLAGNLAHMGYTQGINILLNLFFGPVVNAARGIAVQVQGVVQGFVSNFQTALNPQLTKSYAINDNNRVLELLYLSSRFSFYLMLFLSLPVFLEAPMILKLWLGNVPEHTVNFIRILLLIMLLQTLHNPVSMIKAATGRIRKYQLVIGGILLSIVPISYIFLKIGSPSEVVFIIHFIIQFIAQISAVLMIRADIGLSFKDYLIKIIFKLFSVTLIASVIPFLSLSFLPETFISTVIVIILSFGSVGIAVYFIGFTKYEQEYILNTIRIFRSKKNDKHP